MKAVAYSFFEDSPVAAIWLSDKFTFEATNVAFNSRFGKVALGQSFASWLERHMGYRGQLFPNAQFKAIYNTKQYTIDIKGFNGQACIAWFTPGKQFFESDTTHNTDQNLYSIFESRFFSIIVLNSDLDVLNFNQLSSIHAESLFGHPLQIGLPFSRFIPPRYQNPFNMALQKAVQGQNSREKFYFMTHGRALWFEFFFSPTTNANQQIDGVFISAVDVTESEEAFEKIRKSESRFFTVFNQNPTPSIIYSISQARVLHVSQSFLQKYGYQKDELEKKSVADLPFWGHQVPFIPEFDSKPAFPVSVYDGNHQHRHAMLVVATLDNQRDRQVLWLFDDITERERIKQNLLESEIRYRIVAGLTSGAVFSGTQQPDGDVLIEYLSRKIEQVPVLQKHSALTSMLDNDQAQALKKTLLVLKPNKQYGTELCVTTEGQTKVWLRLSLQKQLKPDNVTEILGGVTNISQEKNAASLLKSGFESYRKIIEKLASGVVIISADGQTKVANDYAIAFFINKLGREPFGNLPFPYGPVMQLNNQPYNLADNPVVYTQTTGQPTKRQLMCLQTPDAQKHWLLLSTRAEVLEVLGGKVYCIVSFTDITRRRLNELKIEELNKNLEAKVQSRTRALNVVNAQLKDSLNQAQSREKQLKLLHNALYEVPIGILMAGFSNQIFAPVFMNPSWQAIFADANNQSIGLPSAIYNQLVDAAHNRADFSDTFELAPNHFFELQFFETKLDGWQNYYLMLCEEVTEKIKNQASLKRQAHRLAILNKELEAFSYSVSHDLKAPLRAIIGFSEALSQKDENANLKPQQTDYIDRVNAAAHHMRDMTDALLMLAKITRNELLITQNNLKKLATEILTELTTAYKHLTANASFIIEDEQWHAGDPRLLRLVLRNLLENAIKYQSPQRSLQIEIRRPTEQEIKLLIMQEKGLTNQPANAFFCVADNGIGFEQAMATKAFLPFARLKKRSSGHGIGLATVKRIVNLHGGWVFALSEPEKGARFFVHLPKMIL